MKVIIKQRHDTKNKRFDEVNVYKPKKQIQTAEVLKYLWEKECISWPYEPPYKTCTDDYADIVDGDWRVEFYVVNLPEIELDL